MTPSFTCVSSTFRRTTVFLAVLFAAPTLADDWAQRQADQRRWEDQRRQQEEMNRRLRDQQAENQRQEQERQRRALEESERLSNERAWQAQQDANREYQQRRVNQAFEAQRAAYAPSTAVYTRTPTRQVQQPVDSAPNCKRVSLGEHLHTAYEPMTYLAIQGDVAQLFMGFRLPADSGGTEPRVVMAAVLNNKGQYARDIVFDPKRGALNPTSMMLFGGCRIGGDPCQQVFRAVSGAFAMKTSMVTQKFGVVDGSARQLIFAEWDPRTETLVSGGQCYEVSGFTFHSEWGAPE